ncbi:MarR family transcriptional regulator [Sulfitobacter sp. MF3-043]|uniref:MarR family transcriptional regulator n=1 Tax=Sulfitobacter sediminivivens TaxID=3252902 RepID=UPI0036DC7E3A
MKNTDQEHNSPRSLYDPQDSPEEDLWFLPGPDAETIEEPLLWQFTDRQTLDAAIWRDAECANAVPLARAAQAYGALHDRLRQSPNALNRIALMQVADLSWHLGDRLTEDRIALYLAARISHARDQMPAFERASWAYRRLTDRQEARPGQLADFLGRTPVKAPAADPLPVDRPQGTEFAALEAEFWDGLSDMSDSHPITRAGFAWQLWSRLDLSGETNRIEGAVVAARIGSGNPATGLRFLPLSPVQRGNTPTDRLAAFYAGTETICLRALMQLDRIASWRDKANTATGHLSGRTPARLIGALTDWPILSAEALETLTRVSRAAVQRNIDKLEKLGLIREVTGQGRFRMWRALT